MEYKTLIADVKIPVIGLGTWKMGGEKDADYSKDDEVINAIKAAIKMGYVHIDTAELYGNGHCEELIAKSIENFERNNLFITTKVFKNNLGYNDLIAAAKRSLKRLKTPYIDLYLIHAPNPEIPIEETMKAMDYLVEQRLVRFIGVSNFTVKDMIAAQSYSKNKIVANQIEYSLVVRNKGRYSGNYNMEKETIPYCQKNGIIVITERPLERGNLLKEHPVLDKLAKKYNKTKAQIALNWTISKSNLVTIPMTTNVEHLKENLGAMGWKLDEKDMKLLDETNFEELGMGR